MFADYEKNDGDALGLRCAKRCGWKVTYGDLERLAHLDRESAVHAGLRVFRELNVARCIAAFHNPCEWSETDWACALAGEVGELCNLIKKMRRHEAVLTADLADEIADVLTYLDLLAHRLDIELGPALTRKFDEVSDRRDCPIKFGADAPPASPVPRPGHVG